MCGLEGRAGLGGVLLQLVERARTEGVRAHEPDLPALAAVVVRVLRHRGRLAAPLPRRGARARAPAMHEELTAIPSH